MSCFAERADAELKLREVLAGRIYGGFKRVLLQSRQGPRGSNG